MLKEMIVWLEFQGNYKYGEDFSKNSRYSGIFGINNLKDLSDFSDDVYDIFELNDKSAVVSISEIISRTEFSGPKVVSLSLSMFSFNSISDELYSFNPGSVFDLDSIHNGDTLGKLFELPLIRDDSLHDMEIKLNF